MCICKVLYPNRYVKLLNNSKMCLNTTQNLNYLCNHLICVNQKVEVDTMRKKCLKLNPVVWGFINNKHYVFWSQNNISSLRGNSPSSNTLNRGGGGVKSRENPSVFTCQQRSRSFCCRRVVSWERKENIDEYNIIT